MAKKYFLGVLTYFKNERSSIYEWILHYKKWGVEHIWMIDNGSEDNYNIEEFINEGFVTLFKEPLIEQQTAYNKYIPIVQKDVTWICNCDLDEFLYSKEGTSIKTIIENKVKPSVELISIQMTIYFPTSFETPSSIIENNIKRKCYDSNTSPKCLYNLDKLNKISIHGKNMSSKKFHITADQTLLCINHYRYISFEILYGIKEGRGCNPAKFARNIKINRTKIHRTKYKYTSGHKLMTLIESLDDNFLSDDTYLRDCSKDVIEKSKLMFMEPCVELYPQSSWLYLKNSLKDKYAEFKSYCNDNRTLTHEQIHEINCFLNGIAKQIL